MTANPTIRDVLAAKRLLRPHLPPTPMWSYPALNALAGATIHLKLEGAQPTGAFKVRGGINLLATMPERDRRRGVVTYSTGNHAQSMAYSARHFGVPCVVVMPARANPAKARAVEALGAELVLHGETLEDARDHAHAIAGDRRLVSPGDEPELIAGVGTAALEMFDETPDLDVLIVPVGSGTGAAAASLVAAAIAPGCEVIGVQSEQAPAAHDSWRSGVPVQRPNATAAEGLATGAGFALPQALMRAHLAGFVLVTDAQIRCAQGLLLSHTCTLTEMAGAAPLAAVLTHRSRFAGARIGLVCSGANASSNEIAAALDSGIDRAAEHGGLVEQVQSLQLLPHAPQAADDHLTAARLT